MTPIAGDLIKNTIGRVVDGLVDRYLPASMSEEERVKFRMEAEKLAIDEFNAAIADVQGARELAVKESGGAPPWTKVLTVTHRPAWSFLMLALFSWTVLAPYFGFPRMVLSDVHRDIMQTVIVFYFGGRSIEKTVSTVWGRDTSKGP